MISVDPNENEDMTNPITNTNAADDNDDHDNDGFKKQIQGTTNNNNIDDSTSSLSSKNKRSENEQPIIIDTFSTSVLPSSFHHHHHHHHHQSSTPKMYLAPCHRFHTNPAMSSPNHVHNKQQVLLSTTTNVQSNNNNSYSYNSNNKAIKRKQRLAQYKAQSSGGVSGSDPSQSHPIITSSGKNDNDNGIESACHIKWAPNLNYIKNVELVAIASPLTSIDNHQQDQQQQQQQHHEPKQQQQQNDFLNYGSSVYVLVFDEGLFSHNGEFSLSSEICDLFGLPTMDLLKHNHHHHHQHHHHQQQQGNRNSYNEEKQKYHYGLRRRVFSNKIIKNTRTSAANTKSATKSIPNSRTTVSESATDNKSDNNIAHNKNDQRRYIQNHLQKIQSSFSSLSNDIMKPLISHVSHELDNTVQILKNEIIGDTSTITNNTYNTVDNQYNNNCTVSGKAECPVKPTLVFRVNLPYSTTAMEVMNIEWNADGTSLCIVQRKKGFSTSTGNALSTNLTNKKKKTNASSNNQIVSPGNTAVSFWCIPQWLHVDYDEMKITNDNDDEEMREDKLIVKANNTSYDCGWEIEDSDENRSLFPLWEWYLSKYVFKDEGISREARSNRKTRIMMKNLMEQYAHSMELTATSSVGSSSLTNHGKKTTARGARGQNSVQDSTNALMNGDVTCIFWENQTPEDERIVGSNAYKERILIQSDNLTTEDEDKYRKGSSSHSIAHLDDNSDIETRVTPSKWIAIGTSKGQVILHNSAASFLSNHTKKSKAKATGTSNAAKMLASMTSQSRTVVIPVRHKKRVTCGAWVDNLLVFGYIGTGCLTLVSTLPPADSGPQHYKQEVIDPIFGEKAAKLLGNIMIPGGRDAVDIQLGNIQLGRGSLTILSVNCEEKCLLFYTFPSLTYDAGIINSTDITSSPAMEINFSMNEYAKGLDLIFHRIIPNTFLVVAAFSSGYIVLIDWVDGSILSEIDTFLSVCQGQIETDGKNDNIFLQDVAFHLPTCTVACLTSTGHVVVYHVRIRGKSGLPTGPCMTKAISCSCKKHTLPKAKASSSQHGEHFIDREESMLMDGMVEILCIKKLAGPGYRLSFSADGESLSVSLGDESVSIFSLKENDEESDIIKHKIAEKIFLFTRFQIIAVFYTVACTLIWLLYNKYQVRSNFYM